MANPIVKAVLAYVPNASTELIEQVTKALQTGYTADINIPKDVLDNIMLASINTLNAEAEKPPSAPRGPTYSDDVKSFLLGLNIPGMEAELRNHGAGS